MSGLHQQMIDAVHRGTAASTAAARAADHDPDADPADIALVEACVRACDAMGEVASSDRDDLAARLRTNSIAVADPQPEVAASQTCAAELRLDEAATSPAVDRARREILRAGYREMRPLSAGAWECVRRTRSSLDVVGGTDDGTRIRLRWHQAGRSWPAVLRPGDGDLAARALPRRAWPLYGPIHVARAIRRRVGLGGPVADVAPFLATPTDLVDDLLALAEVTADDVVVDLGCGDGRIVRAAAATVGCRAIGIERDPNLAEDARRLTSEAGLADRVTIETGDAASRLPAEATVVFLFLPPRAVHTLVEPLLGALGPGGRIVAHEQLPIDPPIRPTRSSLVVGSRSISVAHLWRVGPDGPVRGDVRS